MWSIPDDDRCLFIKHEEDFKLMILIFEKLIGGKL